jgi:hypothetical protein
LFPDGGPGGLAGLIKLGPVHVPAPVSKLLKKTVLGFEVLEVP